MDLGFVNAEQIAKARQEAQASGVGVVDLLLANKVIRPADITQAKAAQFGAEVVQLSGMKIPDEVIAVIPRHIAKKYRVVPVFKSEGKVAVALADPSDLNTIDSLTHLLNAEIDLRVASEQDIEAALNKYYGANQGNTVVDKAIQELTQSEVEIPIGALDDDGAAVDADAPLIRLVNQIIVDAFKLRASDIHLEPLSKRFRLRYRIDGVMQEMKAPPKRLQASIIARLKIQSNMTISEHRIPQDGRIQSKVGNKLIDLRVSCLPTNHGESIVMRNWDFSRTTNRPLSGSSPCPTEFCSSPARQVQAKPRRFIPVCISSTGPTEKSSRSKTRWNIFWPASIRCRSTKLSA